MISGSLIHPTDLRDYATSKGWVLNSKGAEARLYILNNCLFPSRQISFSMDTSVLDYSESVNRAVEKLADIEGRPTSEIAKAVSEVGEDALSFRVITERSSSTSLPLSSAESMITGMQQLLLASACSTIAPQAHHPRLSRIEAKEVLNSARFGHTRPGSFVFNVSCPIDRGEIQSSFLSGDGSLPFARRTTTTLMNSTRQLVDAIESDKVENLLSSVGPNIISANFCDALSKFEDKSLGNSLEISVTWAARLLPNAVDPRLSTIRIQQDYFSRIDEVGRRLRAQVQHQDGKFVGTVEGLEGEMGPDGRRYGDVLLSILTTEGERVEARASLDAEQYAKAYSAHWNEKGFVQIIGRLHPGRQPRRLTNITEFELVAA